MKNLIIVFIASTSLLIGCKKVSYTHEYLLRNPDVLESELEICRGVKEYTSYCDSVKEAADEFGAFARLQQQDPEAFGQLIMRAQVELATSNNAIQQAQEKITQIKSQAPTAKSDKDQQEAQMQLSQAKQDSQVLLLKIRTLLAVVKAQNPVGL